MYFLQDWASPILPLLSWVLLTFLHKAPAYIPPSRMLGHKLQSVNKTNKYSSSYSYRLAQLSLFIM